LVGKTFLTRKNLPVLVPAHLHNKEKEHHAEMSDENHFVDTVELTMGSYEPRALGCPPTKTGLGIPVKVREARSRLRVERLARKKRIQDKYRPPLPCPCFSDYNLRAAKIAAKR
jgi:hypothetical protein